MHGQQNIKILICVINCMYKLPMNLFATTSSYLDFIHFFISINWEVLAGL